MSFSQRQDTSFHILRPFFLGRKHIETSSSNNSDAIHKNRKGYKALCAFLGSFSSQVPRPAMMLFPGPSPAGGARSDKEDRWKSYCMNLIVISGLRCPS